MTSKLEKRTGVISLRLQPHELTAIRGAIEMTGETMSEFLRRVAIAAASKRMAREVTHA